MLDDGLRILADTDLRHLFDADPKRPEIYSLDGAGVHIDFSRQRLDDDSLEKLWSLARAADIPGWTARLYAGEKINGTEDRAALHMALRGDGSFDYKFAFTLIDVHDGEDGEQLPQAVPDEMPRLRVERVDARANSRPVRE